MISPVYKKGRWHFRVWAPEKEKMVLNIVSPFEKTLRMQKDDYGYFVADVETAEKDLQYFFRVDGEKDIPDPASLFQPQGVHGPSQTFDHSTFSWTDDQWTGLQMEDLIIYELHTGLFTPAGTFEAVIHRLDELKETGINAIELMPVAQFPGKRNWGYDGVYPCAVQNSYGGPTGLKKLVDTCHEKGIAVILDVVYNHLGPEGDYFSLYGPYFTDQYCTPWGDAINYDGPWSDGVREYFSENVLQWFRDFHIDGLRCDAIHAIFDNGAVHFWELVHEKVQELRAKTKKNFFLIAESDLNSPKVVNAPANGGYGFQAQWLDDFHHALDVLINPEDRPRYFDFGKMEQLAKAFKEGFVHSGQWVKFRKRKHGRSSAGITGDHFIIFSQNHDQIGNRADGKRLSMLVSYDRARLAAATVLLAPYVPMLFMGEEYGDDAPFFYFVDHSDRKLIEAVQEGRKEEFRDFGFEGAIPDPQDEQTFLQSKLNWQKRDTGNHRLMLRWYQQLISIRKSEACFRDFDKNNVETLVFSKMGLALFRQTKQGNEKIICLFNFSSEVIPFDAPGDKGWEKILDAADRQWNPENKAAENHPQSFGGGEVIRLQPFAVLIYKQV